jgi:hypothetical protein
VSSVGERPLQRVAAAWRRQSRGARIADVALALMIALLTVAVVVNSSADVHDQKRMATDRRALDRFLDDHQGGKQRFIQPYWIHVRHRTDFACAWFKTSKGGICMRIVSTTIASSTILKPYRCIDLPRAPKHAKHWKPPRPPHGNVYCPAHSRRLIV